MGGNKTAQIIAAAGIIFSPVFAAFVGFYSMNAFEPMLAVFVLFYLVKMFNENKPAYWIQAGILSGLKIMNKHTAKDKNIYNTFAILFLLIFILFFIGRTGRIDRFAFSLLGVIPAGAIFIEHFVEKIKQRWIYITGGALMIFSFIMFIPLLILFLSYENSAKLTELYRLNTEIEAGKKPLIPQFLADRIGWKEKADMVGKIFLSLPETERERTIIAADNYDNAGALEFYGKKYGFKNVVYGHNNYYLWSKERLDGDIILQLTNKKSFKGLKEAFEIVDSNDVFFDNIYCSPHERNLTVFICRKPLHPLEELLESEKHFY